MRVQVKDFMSTPVAIAVEESSIQEIRLLMKREGIHAIPIIRYSKKLPDIEITIQGIVTSTDLNNDLDGKTPAREVMTPNVHIIHKHSSAQAAAKMMEKRKVHHLVVMDDGKIMGIISSFDFVKLVAEYSLG